MANFEQEFNLISGKFCLLRTIFISLTSNHQPSIKAPSDMVLCREGLLVFIGLFPWSIFRFFTLYWLNFHLGNQEKAKLWQTKKNTGLKWERNVLVLALFTFLSFFILLFIYFSFFLSFLFLLSFFHPLFFVNCLCFSFLILIIFSFLPFFNFACFFFHSLSSFHLPSFFALFISFHSSCFLSYILFFLFLAFFPFFPLFFSFSFQPPFFLFLSCLIYFYIFSFFFLLALLTTNKKS